MLEKVDQDIQDVRAGKKVITDDYRVVNVPPQSSTDFPTLEEWEKSEGTALMQMAKSIEADERLGRLQQGVNLQRIGIYAWEEADNKQGSQGSDEAVDDDWLRKWRVYAKDIRAEQLQRMWAKILVEETLEPDSYSFHTLELLNRLSKKEATIMAKLASFELVGILPSFASFGATYEEVGISLDDFLHLENLGLLNGVAIDTLHKTINRKDDGEIMQIHPYGEYGLLIRAFSQTPVKVRGTAVAPVGAEIFSLIPNRDDVDNIRKSGTFFATQLGDGVRIDLVRITGRIGTTISCDPLERLGYSEA